MPIVQLGLDGEPLNQPVIFDCPICEKEIIVKRDEKGNYYHRAWMFHFTYEHGKTALKYVKDSIMTWLYYFVLIPPHPLAKELIDEWKTKVKE